MTNRRSSVATRPPLWVLAGAFLLYVLRFGYDWGTSDQDEIIPLLLHRLDPTLFTQDWLVQAQASTFGVRSYFVGLLQGLATVLPVWLAVLVLYVCTWLLVAGAVYAIAHLLTRDRLAAAASVVIVLVMTPLWTLGGNDLVHRMLVPSMLGWAIGLWGVVAFLHGRHGWSGALLGLATWMQALVGLHLALLLGLLLGTRSVTSPTPWKRTSMHLATFGATFAIAALPSLGILAYQQLGPASGADGAEPSLFYIIAQFRNPHHYLFFSFSERSMIRFAGLAAAGGLALWMRPEEMRRRFMVRCLGIIAAACTFGFFFTEAVPLLFVAKLQLFKMTVFAKLLLVVALCHLGASWLPGRLRRAFEWGWAHPRGALGLVLIGGAVVASGYLAGIPYLRERAYPVARQEAPEYQLAVWARAETPRDAVFAIPPTWSTFRTHARRAIVINFKAFIFRDRLVREWFDRLTDMAPMPLPERLGASGMHLLDDAYADLSAERLLTLADRYGFTYVVRPEDAPLSHPAFTEVFSAGRWTTYALDEVPPTP